MARTKWMLLLIVVAFVGTPMSIFADGLGATVWGLNGFNPGGSISWDGTNGLIGSGIWANYVQGDGTPLNNGSAPQITSGSLSFNTGAGSYNGGGTQWSWGAGTGATLALTGCIADLAITDCNTVLLEDSFQSVNIIPYLNGFDLVFGGIQGTINQTVADYFGLGTQTGFAAASFNFQIATNAAPGTAFTATAAIPGTITANATVPEDWNAPMTLGFFAVALATFGAARRLGLLQAVVG